ncbi:MAG: glycoside hydrolase, partial [Actinomycetota bacterium]|nr:glycoside hydrolase [Actinomycetota bacterium]
ARSGPLFGPEWSQPAQVPRSAGHRRVERDLSVQLSGWMVLEAAALLERASG